MNKVGVRGYLGGIKGSLAGSAILFTLDGALFGSYLVSLLVCPIWFLISLPKNAIERPGWGLALVRIGFPALTLGLVWANNAVQLGVAEANAQRVIAACEKYRSVNGRFPEKLDELIPLYLNSVPRAKYCVHGDFNYFNFGEARLYWVVVPPFYRKIYNFDSRRWSYLD